MIFPVFQTDILIDPYKGIHLVTTYWSDGSKTQEHVPKSPIIIHGIIWPY